MYFLFKKIIIIKIIIIIKSDLIFMFTCFGKQNVFIYLFAWHVIRQLESGRLFIYLFIIHNTMLNVLETNDINVVGAPYTLSRSPCT